MAAIGTGNTQPGVVTASLGTSGTLFAFSTVPIIDPQGEVAAFCDSTDNWLLLICTLNLTLVTEHVRNLFGWEVCLQSGEGVGLGGAIQAGWVWSNEQGSGTTLAEICARLVQAVETSRNEPNANASQVYSDALNRTSEIRKAFSEAKLI
jgi:sugar (pentulose or hexulose) kinase